MKIGLGTAQFGLSYGITNDAGQVGPEAVRDILHAAQAAGIDTLDTAHLYGQSEAVLGQVASDAFRIVTKTPKFASVHPHQVATKLRAAFQESLANVGRTRVYGLLVHDPADLLGPAGRYLWNAMEELKAESLVTKIGVSVYEGAEIDAALQDFAPELVQVPFNPLDQRLVTGGQLVRLAAAGVEVHARSLFLQGLLLQPPSRIPRKFAGLAEAVSQLGAAAEATGLSQLEAVLALAFQRREIHRYICGVTTLNELQAIIRAAKRVDGVEKTVEFATCGTLDPRLLNPARWSELG